VEFRAAVRTSRIIDNRPLFLFNYGASGNRALFVGGGAWVVESTPNGDLVLKSTTSGSTVQEITCNLTFGATEADWPQIDGSRRLWPIVSHTKSDLFSGLTFNGLGLPRVRGQILPCGFGAGNGACIGD